MKTATVHELKAELQHLPPKRLVEISTRLARFKKENKELLTYLLFEAHDELAYAANVKAHLDAQFEEVNGSTMYYAKKSLRKIVRVMNKFIRFSGSKETEVQLRLHFLSRLVDSNIAFRRNTVLENLYRGQLKLADKALATLHEDLQYEYRTDLDRLRNAL